jgi:hypothetical protein
MIGEKAYQNAMRRRAELRQELDEIERFLQLCEKFARPPDVTADVTVQAKATASMDAVVMRHSEVVSGMELVPHIRRAILDIGRPQSRSGVVKALSDRGIQVGGQDPVTNVGTVMWRAKQEFVNLKPHGYWPRDVAYTAAGYDPAESGSQGEDEGPSSDQEPDAPIRETPTRNGASADLWGS